eukprot:1625202-Pleurochrysis_carterae.AAC.4
MSLAHARTRRRVRLDVRIDAVHAQRWVQLCELEPNAAVTASDFHDHRCIHRIDQRACTVGEASLKRRARLSHERKPGHQ